MTSQDGIFAFRGKLDGVICLSASLNQYIKLLFNQQHPEYRGRRGVVSFDFR